MMQANINMVGKDLFIIPQWNGYPIFSECRSRRGFQNAKYSRKQIKNFPYEQHPFKPQFHTSKAGPKVASVMGKALNTGKQ